MLVLVTGKSIQESANPQISLKFITIWLILLNILFSHFWCSWLQLTPKQTNKKPKLPPLLQRNHTPTLPEESPQKTPKATETIPQSL